MANYYIYCNQLVQGPYSRAQLDQMARSGAIAASTQVCIGQGSPWQPYNTLPPVAVPALKPVSPAQSAAQEKVRFVCPHCGQPYLSASSRLGQEMICRSCQKPFVPTAAAAPGATSAPAAQSVPAAQSATASAQSSAQSPAQSSAQSSAQSTAQPAQQYTQPVRDTGVPYSSPEIPEGDILCPHCWQKFDSEYLLYIAQHPSLIGDPVLGASAQQRFAPTVFNALGLALDAAGAPCNEMACPRCHLPIPSSVIEEASFCCSIVGAPSSGKTYFLTSLLHMLRQSFTNEFACSLLDANPGMNRMLNDYESTLFRSAHRDKVAVLAKTELEGGAFYNQLMLDNIPVQLPKPFIYELRHENDKDQGVNLVFYDNPGEHFQPGQDNLQNPTTRHLGYSDAIIFLFDPVNDAAMRPLFGDIDPQLTSDAHVCDQTVLLSEMIGRIRKLRNLSAAEHCDIPLVVAVGKYDVWRGIFDNDFAANRPVRFTPDALSATLDRDRIMSTSFALRELLLGYVPELVQTAETFFNDVTFVPFSNFGRPAYSSEASGQFGIIPSEIAPIWVDVPMLHLLAKGGLLPTADADSCHAQELGSVIDNSVVFLHPVNHRRVRLPDNYRGVVLTIGGRKYQLPAPAVSAANTDNDLWS